MLKFSRHIPSSVSDFSKTSKPSMAKDFITTGFEAVAKPLVMSNMRKIIMDRWLNL